MSQVPTPNYQPPRALAPAATDEPLEIELVYNVTPCGTCSFFWPPDPAQQPYGPYTAFDFTTNTPTGPETPDAFSFPWLKEITAPPAFPNPEIMDGCRKAPIMTIGINPNLTAFAPGQTGASWCYPNFSSANGTDLYTKTAYYYRYRSVYQERYELPFIEQFLSASPRVVAPLSGTVVSVERPTDSPSFDLKVRYDGDLVDTTIPLTGTTGSPPWVVLFDPIPPHNQFNAGDVIAAQLDVRGGQPAQLYRQQVGYYEQFVPVLKAFESTLCADGHADAKLKMGEDVCQLDMVACASPHWTPDFLGGSPESERTIIENCVVRNHWAVRQLVQTNPIVLYLVGEATFNMFRNSLGALIVRDVPLSPEPADGAFTLLRETSDPSNPCFVDFSYLGLGRTYELRTRLVVTPHFSYSTNFLPQFRLSPSQWQDLQANDAATATFLTGDARITMVPPARPDEYTAFLLQPATVDDVKAEIVSRFTSSAPLLAASLYEPHAMMAGVLSDLYATGALSYGPINESSAGLRRTDGACAFCVNSHWSFPLGCPYGKPSEEQPPAGFLRDAAAAMVLRGSARSPGPVSRESTT